MRLNHPDKIFNDVSTLYKLILMEFQSVLEPKYNWCDICKFSGESKIPLRLKKILTAITPPIINLDKYDDSYLQVI